MATIKASPSTEQSENGIEGKGDVHNGVAEVAAATQKEHTLPVRQGLKAYRKAIGQSTYTGEPLS